jgi:YidC/Oxa1 family membrane protein insertase
MDSEFRRILVAMLVAMAVFIGYRMVVVQLFPEPEEPIPAERTVPEGQPAPPPATTQDAPVAPTTAPETGPAGTLQVDVAPTEPTGGLELSAGDEEDAEPIVLGGTAGAALKLELIPRGGSVTRLWLYRRDDDGEFVHSAEAGVNEPYELLSPGTDTTFASFTTHRIWVDEWTDRYPEGLRLSKLAWEVDDDGELPDAVAFTATIRDAAGAPVLSVRKRYAIVPGKPVVELTLTVANHSEARLTVRLDQDGPAGVQKEHIQYDMRRLLSTQMEGNVVSLNSGYQFSGLQKATIKGEVVRLLDGDKGRFVWTALANKYFAVFTRPLPRAGAGPDFIAGVTGLVANVVTEKNHGDLIARLTTRPEVIPPAGEVSFPLEIYAGPKDPGYLAKIDETYVDPERVYFQLAQSADRRCMCTFQWLQDLMVWLLETIYLGVQNYGVAIIILVIIVRGLLHPLTVFQQKSMFRMQEAMGKLQPKMAAIREKYANDKARQNQELLKLYGEEGVNPMANMVSFLPLFLQMPILVALWTALNTDVNLRHAPFDGYWITDLSAPDALIQFATPIDIPILSWIPFIGRMFQDIPSFNLLPVLMGVSMWLQQKYMPKPHMQAKLDAARKEREDQPDKPKTGMTPEDQMRQQQMVAYLMSIMFPLMFYYMPSGLNLYWMSTNIVGIGESLVVRRQIKREKEQREKLGPPPKKPPGPLSRWFKRMAAQFEEVQKQADKVAKLDDPRKRAEKAERKAGRKVKR